MIVGIEGRTSSSSWGKEFGLSACFHKSARNALKGHWSQDFRYSGLSSCFVGSCASRGYLDPPM